MIRPIIFSGPMVRALLAGRKTQTRRVVKNIETLPNGMITPKAGYAPRRPENHVSYCPYGQSGDLLWVRETWAQSPLMGYMAYRADGDEFSNGDGTFWRPQWTPSVHMPRWASRLTLRVTDVRVERVQEISREDAIAEGIDRWDETASITPYRNYRKGQPGEMDLHCSCPERSFMTLWESIKGPGSWDENPWVWAISFEVVTTNVNTIAEAEQCSTA